MRVQDAHLRKLTNERNSFIMDYRILQNNINLDKLRKMPRRNDKIIIISRICLISSNFRDYISTFGIKPALQIDCDYKK